ncbi:hypothetical protein D6779_04480 [Candidatus Parcubacteria bacterium]|nr:MAG: hypothetical protein D6779_04480 [Candidatus Parcubacteria bacterium]
MKNLNRKDELLMAYAMYGVSIFLPLAALLGALIVFMRKKYCEDANLTTHYDWLRNSFYIGFGGLALAALAGTASPFFGVITVMVVFIWYASRVVKGMFYFFDGKGLNGADLNFGVDDGRQDIPNANAA